MSGNTGVPVYQIGQRPTVTALFTNQTNTPTNPTTVTFQITDPTGTQVNTATPNAAITNPSTGTFIFTFTAALTVVGTYAVRVKGVGVVDNAEERSFVIYTPLTPTP